MILTCKINKHKIREILEIVERLIFTLTQVPALLLQTIILEDLGNKTIPKNRFISVNLLNICTAYSTMTFVRKLEFLLKDLNRKFALTVKQIIRKRFFFSIFLSYYSPSNDALSEKSSTDINLFKAIVTAVTK